MSIMIFIATKYMPFQNRSPNNNTPIHTTIKIKSQFMNLNMHVVPSEGLKMSPNNIIYKEIYTMGIKEFSIRNRK